ncbi:MAG: sigma-70 family RNA polymerase sigma factor [Acidobacteriota bacterium]
MPEGGESDTTRLLIAWSQGDQQALDRLMPRVYDELRQIALGYLRREREDHTLQTSALIHEAFLRLIDQQQVSWRNRAHFLGIAARMMRRVLVDHARHQGYVKRGGDQVRVALSDANAPIAQRPPYLVALDEALQELEQADPQQAHIVELRYFGGLTLEEIATVLDVSVSSVTRKWRLAKAWLYRTLEQHA